MPQILGSLPSLVGMGNDPGIGGGGTSGGTGGGGGGGSPLGSLGGILSLGSTAYNLYNQYQNQQYQNLLRSYAQDPAKMNAYAAQFTQPLNAGLTASVANNAQAYLAQRGLSDSPQISQQVEAQEIAPYIQKNQQTGYQDALQALNIGGGAISPALQQQNSLAALTKAFSQYGGGGGGGNPSANAPGALPSAQTYGSVSAPSVIQNPYAGLGPDPGYTPIDLSNFYTPNYSSGDTDADAE